MNELPKPIKIDENAAIRDEFLTPYVEGVARQQHIEVPGRTSEIAMLVVFFEAGSRNRPHTHEHDQTLLVLSDRTMVARETEKYVLSAGEVITIPANIWHWHGATRDAPTCQMSIMVPGKSNFEADERNWATNYTEG
jgi:quercetin dioxygenase-like cupin family protein